MYPNIQKQFPELLSDCEIIMSYPVGKIFTSETPSGKEKKHEARCTKIVDSYYSIESKHHQAIRNLLHDIESTLLLFSDSFTPEMLMTSLGRLQVRFEAYNKLIQKSIKSEKVLVDYYSTMKGVKTLLVQGEAFVVTTNYNGNIYPEVVTYFKKVFGEGVKIEKGILKGA